MTSRDFGYLTLRNTTSFNSDDTFVEENYVFTVSTYGRQKWTNNLILNDLSASTITTNSTIVSSVVIQNFIAGTILFSTLHASTVTAEGGFISNVTTSSILASTINASYIDVSTLHVSSFTDGFLQLSTLTVSTVTASTVNTHYVDVSTITASTIQPSSIIDMFLSAGTPNQVMFAGPSGGQLEWSTLVCLPTGTCNSDYLAWDTNTNEWLPGLQASNSLRIGCDAGVTNQGQNAVAFGTNAGSNNQGDNAITFGVNTTAQSQNSGAIAFGLNKGIYFNNQGNNAIFLGTNPDTGFLQAENGIAIGTQTGYTNQRPSSIAIGFFAASNQQSTNAIAIGPFAGNTNQHENTIAIGENAGFANQHSNTIILNARGYALDSIATDSFYVAPVREESTTTVLYYNPGTKEVSYGEPITYWTLTGTNDIYNNNSGNVGIGTSTPSVKLDIAGQTQIDNGDLLIKNDVMDGNSNSVSFLKSRAALSTMNGDELGYISFYGTSSIGTSQRGAYILATQDGAPAATNIPGKLQFYTTSTSEAQRMTIESHGNVGIGITAPYKQLQVLVSSTAERDALHGIAAKSGDVNTIIGANDASNNRGSIQVTNGDQLNLPYTLDINPLGGNINIGNGTKDIQLLGSGTTVYGQLTALNNVTIMSSLRVDGSATIASTLTTSTIRISSIIDSVNSAGMNNQFLSVNASGNVVWSTIASLPNGVCTSDYLTWNGSSWVSGISTTSSITIGCSTTISPSTIALNASGVSLSTLSTNAFYVSPIRYDNANSTLYYDATTKEITYGVNIDTIIGETFKINQDVYEETVKKDTITYDVATTIKTSGVSAEIDGWSDNAQVYTFGQQIPNLWVAGGLGTQNTLAYSNDGINWIGLGTGIFTDTTTYGCRGVAWNGSLWVAVGAGTNSIAYSYDGITWNGLGTTIFSTAGYGVAWNGTMWVAVGLGGNEIAYSYDGISWTGVIAPSAGLFSVAYGVAWNGRMWVAVGSGTSTSSICYSYDGMTWNYASSAGFTSAGYGVAWNGTMWVAVGDGTNSIVYSSDGINWTVSMVDGDKFNAVYGVAWNGILWVAVGQATVTSSICYSYNGMTWNYASSAVFTVAPGGTGVAWNGRMFVATGKGTNSIAYSNDGINWIGIATGSSNFSTNGFAVAYNGKRPHTITYPTDLTVAVGNGTNEIAYSYDGISWTGVGTIFGGTTPAGKGVAWNGSLWVAVGGAASAPTNTIAYSYNGTTWSGLSGSTGIFSTTGNGIAWNGTMWVAVGQGTNSIAYSYDGFTWTGLGTTIFGTAGYSVAWNGSKWVAVGSGTNTIAYSYNGLSWTGLGDKFGGTTATGYGVAWNGTMWIAVGGDASGGTPTNSISYSYDGINWTGLGNSIFGIYGRAIAWNGSLWVAVGKGSNSIAYSYDGISWAGLGSTILGTVGNGVTWNGSFWVAVGQGTNSIAYSSNGISWTGLGIIMFTTGYGIAWNSGLGSTYIQQPTIALGSGTNTLAYSPDGIQWIGLGKSGTAGSKSPFLTQGNGAAWNGTIWAAVGSGTNSIAYSYDGLSWTGLGTSIFSTQGNAVAWNGSLWVAVGQGTNSIAYSYDGLSWRGVTGASATIFTTAYGVAWNGTYWMVVGNGGSTVCARSTDGITWTATPTQPFAAVGYGIATNGTRWVVVGGSGTNPSAYSDNNGITWAATTGGTGLVGTYYGVAWNGINWVMVGYVSFSIFYTILRTSTDGYTWNGILDNTIFSTGAQGICWNGTRWIAVGSGGNEIAYSAGDIAIAANWRVVTGTAASLFTAGIGVASNPRVGATVVDSQLVLNKNGVGLNNNLDILSNGYYNNGYTNFTVNVNSHSM